MKEHNIQLTTPEIAALWTTYIQNSATICFYIHFLHHLQDLEIKPIVEEALHLNRAYIKQIETIFIEDDFPIPKGFSDKDIDLTAPPLYTDLFDLSFVYRVGQMSVPNYSTILTKVARSDVFQFFEDSLKSSTELYKRSLNLMLSKGVYDRPPKIPYPNKVEYMKKQQSLLSIWFGDKRPLNTAELSEIFYTIERNYIGVLLLMGLIQVMRDEEIKQYLIKGKKLSEKQIDIFNKILRDEEHLGNIPVSLEVTNSTTSPFSNRLILFLITSTSGTGIYLLAYAMSNSMRKDLVAHYSLLIPEIMKYGGEGLEIMIKRGWMEQPPQQTDRHDLYNA
ncbi:DUF3231 family protein [Bacillus sp. 1NLA3E]|uniref:DUF3231 family protein n=1 Tax=Bacillus sp. 1NLA3E TaxID=666686 RepID=UPI000247E87B|nr:DUF3231 family protein [Bacillus sp. 1NLA3E]AGK55862.1 hypothetical protein B1NLA3E_20620 [Bacillus sp. 1NLA3E]